jgi:hypothetical protein
VKSHPEPTFPPVNINPTDLSSAIQGYVIYTRADGKSINTITLNTYALNLLRHFLTSNH